MLGEIDSLVTGKRIDLGRREAIAIDTGNLPLQLLEEAARLLAVEGAPKRRRKLWEIDGFYHCPIIGTCLAFGELRQIMRRVDPTLGSETDHALHQAAVRLAARHDAPAKLLTRALDHRHAAAIRRYGVVKDEAGLRSLWAESLTAGEIPGAFWALLSHPACGSALMRAAMGDIHMLSHLMGASNRADIRRLRALEAESETLHAELAQARRRRRVEAGASSARIAELEARLAAVPATAEHASTDGTVVELRERLAAAMAEVEQFRARLSTLEARLAERDAELGRLGAELTLIAQELGALEATLAPPEVVEADVPRLHPVAGRVLLVGGRPAQLPHLRRLVEGLGGELIHHDGGREQAVRNLPGLVQRADLVVVPVDCVSHAASLAAKRTAGQQGKRFLALRTAGAGSLARALLAQPVAVPAS